MYLEKMLQSIGTNLIGTMTMKKTLKFYILKIQVHFYKSTFVCFVLLQWWSFVDVYQRGVNFCFTEK